MIEKRLDLLVLLAPRIEEQTETVRAAIILKIPQLRRAEHWGGNAGNALRGAGTRSKQAQA
jgi:hypothetical protein